MFSFRLFFGMIRNSITRADSSACMSLYLCDVSALQLSGRHSGGAGGFVVSLKFHDFSCSLSTKWEGTVGPSKNDVLT